MNREFRSAVKLLLRKTRHGMSMSMSLGPGSDRPGSTSARTSLNLRARGSDSGFRDTEIDQSSLDTLEATGV